MADFKYFLYLFFMHSAFALSIFYLNNLLAKHNARIKEGHGAQRLAPGLLLYIENSWGNESLSLKNSYNLLL